jgi:glycosyltransferase involved in cell wall biosynthesis
MPGVGVHVSHVVPSLFDAQDGILGGAERYVLELARHMADVVPTSLITFGDHPGERHDGKLRVQVFRSSFTIRGERTNPFSLRALRAALSATVVHTHQTHVLLSSIVALVSKVARNAVFTTDLGGGGFDISQFIQTDGWYRGHLHISEYSRRIFGHEGLSSARVILGGVDTTKFIPGPGGGGALFVGRLLPHKGIDVLVQALPAELPLTVVGTSLHPQYRARLAALARGKAVRFVESPTDSELVALYRGADVIVLPSVYTDCYGNTTRVPELLGQTLLEGMAAGLPAIATRVASLPEVVEDQVTGLLVEPNDLGQLRTALYFVRSNPTRARLMGAAGRERVISKFSWAATVQRCLIAYAELSNPA